MNFNLALRKYFSSSSYKSVHKYNPSYVRQIDHCAFRSIDKYQYKVIHDECLSFGLIPQKETYHFPEINVVAGWYKSSNIDSMIPRIFSSLYLGTDIDLDRIKYFYDYYEKILTQNHYVAWTTLFPYEMNHIGFSVENIKDVYMDLKKNGFSMNGDIQISNDNDLLQFSLKADKIEYPFVIPGIKSVYGPFIEFIQRKNQREGFHTRNASKIFESTKDN